MGYTCRKTVRSYLDVECVRGVVDGVVVALIVFGDAQTDRVHRLTDLGVRGFRGQTGHIGAVNLQQLVTCSTINKLGHTKNYVSQPQHYNLQKLVTWNTIITVTFLSLNIIIIFYVLTHG